MSSGPKTGVRRESSDSASDMAPSVGSWPPFKLPVSPTTGNESGCREALADLGDMSTVCDTRNCANRRKLYEKIGVFEVDHRVNLTEEEGNDGDFGGGGLGQDYLRKKTTCAVLYAVMSEINGQGQSAGTP